MLLVMDDEVNPFQNVKEDVWIDKTDLYKQSLEIPQCVDMYQ